MPTNLLDYFAGLAMQGLLSGCNEYFPHVELAKEAYRIAEVMMLEKNKRS